MTHEVFLSYARNAENETIATQIDQAFKIQGINVIRDKKDAGYKANIQDFMQQIGQGKCVLVVISDKYLKSENCMFELVEITNNGDVCDLIFPIVLSDANIYDAIGRLDYLDYWDNKKKTLQERMRNSSDFAKRGSINDALDQYAVIRDNIDQLADTLKNMNTLTPDMHRDSKFETVIEAVKAKLAE